MKILFHCIYFPPEVGGLESHVYHLARALVKEGHHVQVVTARSIPDLASNEEMDGIQVHRTWFPRRDPAGWMAHALGSAPLTRTLARDADVIHAQAFASVVPAQLARLGRDTPLAATFHTSHFLMRAGRPLWRPILSRLVRLPDHALAASAEIANVAMMLAPGVRVEALANGVDTDLFCSVEPALPVGSRPRFIVPRRLFPKNGVEFFIRALPRILAQEEVEALLVGDGPERQRLEALARELGVADRVTFLGKKAHTEMPGLLCSADLAVIPSLMEATSVAALESMACQLPVWASNVGGLPEIVDDEVGGLFRAGDPEALAQALVKGLRAGGLKEKGVRARERVVARWSNQRLALRHLEIYEDLLGRRIP